MTTEAMKAATTIIEGNQGPISINQLLKVCTDLIKEASDLAGTINHLQGRSQYKIDNPDLNTGIQEVPEGFYQDERITTKMLIDQYLEYKNVYNRLLLIPMAVVR
ncbi:MAG: hypothetical protein NC548_45990 [Lachnospiraceae bacterium]|nr:hypothetical protein [Lachnospiraceae bacterium]